MKGKIAFQRLDWESSYLEIENSIKMLQKAIPLLSSDDDKINHEMFIAEYARVFADSAIWHKDYELAKNYLDKASEIYTRLKVKGPLLRSLYLHHNLFRNRVKRIR